MEQPTNETRRRLTKSALAGSIVISSLLSRPVLGAPYQCTVSGQLSGNMSNHTTEPCFNLGQSPEYWEQSLPADQPFDSVFKTSSVVQQLSVTDEDDGCAYVSDRRKKPRKVMFSHILMQSGYRHTCTRRKLEQAAVANYLNASVGSPGKPSWPNFPLKPQEVVDMYNAVCNGGTYQHSSRITYSSDDVLKYFETLY